MSSGTDSDFSNFRFFFVLAMDEQTVKQLIKDAVATQKKEQLAEIAKLKIHQESEVSLLKDQFKASNMWGAAA